MRIRRAVIPGHNGPWTIAGRWRPLLRRRDAAVCRLAEQLAEARALNAALTERLAWYEAAMEGRPHLRAVQDTRQ